MNRPHTRLFSLLHQLRSITFYAVLGLGSIAPAAHAADALNGKSIFLNGPPAGGPACASCHGPSPANNVNGILAAANNPTVISNAFAQNLGGMGSLFNGKLNASQIADLAAFIGNPNVTAAPAATVSPSTLTFSGTTLGQTSGALEATLSNSGSAALNIGSLSITGSAAGDFLFVGGGTCANGGAVAAGASCTIHAAFKPTVVGARAASISITHNATGGSSTIALNGTGNAVPQASIAVSANSLSFGSVLLNTPSTAQGVTVSNSGQTALNLTAISLSGTNASVFTLGGTCSTQAAVAAGASCSILVQANPTSAGNFSASLNITSNASNGAAAISLSATGAAPLAVVAASPTAVAFGNQTIGTPATQTVTLTNTGNIAATFTSIAVSGSSDIAIGTGNTCGASLAPGAKCAVPLVFNPSAAAAVTASLAIASNAAAVQVGISGTGTAKATAKPGLSDSGSIAFDDTQVGKSSAVHTTTLSNTGTAALKITSLVLGGAQPGDFVLGGTCATNATVNPSGSCTVESSFKPSAAGARAASLLLVTDAGAQFNLALAGNGIAVVVSTPMLSITPQSFDFGAVTIGGTAPTKRFTLSNTGTSAVSLTSATFSGPFSGVADSSGCPVLPFSLQAGTSCDLVVQYLPVSAGTSNGNVVIQSSDAATKWTISFSGEASVATPVNSGGSGATDGSAPQNHGGGGCSAAESGNDPLLVLMVFMALLVIVWRRRQAKAGVSPR
ncbi:choice-of-anchor D domain-containing protein [Undibacterium sp. TJN25]|uniref:choice-of-anchor D domain-containing protein n=1 Tax=Undibacterium sp. TJN25 TaxID=3413056 RepID=UPI003BF1CEE9